MLQSRSHRSQSEIGSNHIDRIKLTGSFSLNSVPLRSLVTFNTGYNNNYTTTWVCWERKKNLLIQWTFLALNGPRINCIKIAFLAKFQFPSYSDVHKIYDKCLSFIGNSGISFYLFDFRHKAYWIETNGWNGRGLLSPAKLTDSFHKQSQKGFHNLSCWMLSSNLEVECHENVHRAENLGHQS